MKKSSVLFVCLGNICRSPLAEGLLLDKIERHGLEGSVRVESAGTSNYHIGELPDPRMRRTAASRGIDLKSKARQFRVSDFQGFDLIIAMDDQNLSDILELEPDGHSARVFKMGYFLDPNLEPDIPDPWFGGEAGFQEVFKMLDMATENLLQHLLRSGV
ncbi:MAG: low molecular weight phosphotyrosine protein phosphatase [Flavobacteriales bacterium]|nr:low molecular weight phosphotyrosine protein phosphatase [Flavobacteriales bacterium]